jgi:glycogen synthase
MDQKIAFTSYETPYAPCGGIAAVMARLPGYMMSVSGLETVVITPYHHQIEKTTTLALEWLGEVSVPYEDLIMEVKVGRLVDRDGVAWVFLKVEDPRFFAGIRHPYDVGRTQQEIGVNLRRDALFYGSAAAKALSLLDPAAAWIVMMQDWEGAVIQLALDEKSITCRSFLTMHNSYDSGGVDSAELRQVGIDAERCPGPAGSSRASVLERVLVGRREPVFTVSRQFAADLAEDTYQARIMAPHLQGMLAGRLVGVDNGPFASLAVDSQILQLALDGKYSPFQAWKKQRKTAAVTALEAYVPSPDRPVWGDLMQFGTDADSPWFVMAGRDDTRQKGYDVASLAIRRYLKSGGAGHFLFFPIPGDEGKEGLGFLEKLAGQFSQRVLVMPFIFKEGFTAALQGAAFGLMPSLYEPFGMANEFYLNGTPAIGRATGGIVQQIIPWRGGTAYTPAASRLANRWYVRADRPSGILFREPEGLASEMIDWRSINLAGYDPTGGTPDRLEERSRYPLVQAMASQLQMALADGVRLYQQPQRYARMLAQGVRHIQQGFSWDRAAGEYWKLVSAPI